MNSKAMQKAKEWFKKAEHDLATVEMIINASGYPDVASVLLQPRLWRGKNISKVILLAEDGN